jgi:hypothetical protein
MKPESKANLNSSISTGNSGILASWLSASRLSKQSIANELESDNYGIQLMRENKFAPTSLKSIFTLFQKSEEKSKSIRGNENHGFYFRSHPTNVNRIKNVEKQFTPSELDGGEKFFYDSLEFVTIKKRAIDESINLFFEHKDYINCLEMSFRQHLFYPNDEYYIFYIVECLQRQLKMYDEFYSLNFIMWRYNLKIPLDAENDKPKFIETLGTYPLYHEYVNTVFYHLTDFIFNINDNELQQLRNRNLVKNDTLEFITNMDALQYFKKKLPAACAICNLAFNKNKTSYGAADTSKLGDIEKKYLELNKTKETFQIEKVGFENTYSIIYNIDSWSRLGPYGGLNYAIENNLYQGFLEYSKKKESSGTDIKQLNNLGLRDESYLKHSCSALTWLYWPEKSHQKYRVKINLLEVDPELMQILAKQRAKTLFFTNVVLQTDINVGVYEEDGDYIKCGYTVYKLDVISNTLEYIYSTVYLKNDGSFNALYEAISKGYWELMK